MVADRAGRRASRLYTHQMTAPLPPGPPGSQDRMTSSYVKVLVLQLAVLAALWWLEHAFI